MPLFSIIIATYNRASLLDQTLRSVFAQRFTDFEVLVADDGSTDDTGAVLSRFESRLRSWRQSNRGPGAARNLAASHARGQYLAFLDSDDVWFPWTLEVYRQVAIEAGAPAFITGKPFRFQAPGQLAAVQEGKLSTAVFADYYASGDQWRWYGASSFVVRADLFRAVNGFTDDWINGEDADLAMRLGAAPGFVQILGPSMFGYREHAGTAISSVVRTMQGAQHAIRVELAGGYPGGAARAAERRQILLRLIRPVMLDGLRSGLRRDAWRLYVATAPWHMRLGRWRFLAAFPLMTAAAASRVWRPSGRTP